MRLSSLVELGYHLLSGVPPQASRQPHSSLLLRKVRSCVIKRGKIYIITVLGVQEEVNTSQPAQVDKAVQVDLTLFTDAQPTLPSFGSFEGGSSNESASNSGKKRKYEFGVSAELLGSPQCLTLPSKSLGSFGDFHVILGGNIGSGKSFLLEHLQKKFEGVQIRGSDINYLDEDMSEFAEILPQDME